MNKRRWLIGAALVASVLFPACDASLDNLLQAVRSPVRPNIVILVLDTVRRDRLSIYGYERETTPFLEELVKTSRLYTHAYSTSTWTAPAHGSLFTGLLPIAHGATQERWHLDAAQITLAERLAQAGYRTFGVVENPAISKQLGFGQGFEFYQEIYRRRQRNTLRAFRGLVTQDPDRPFFGFVNLIAAHAPYDGPDSSLPGLRDRFLPPSAKRIQASKYRWHGFYGGYREFTPTTFDRLGDLYDACILTLDGQVRGLVQVLKNAGAWENTLLVVTSDHGENLGENGHYEHVFSLYEPTIRIPLMIRYPKFFAPGSQDHRPVQLTDIMPSLMSLLELGGEFQGRDLLSSDFDDSRVIFAEYYRPEQALNVLEGRMLKLSADVGRRSREELRTKYLRRLRAVVHEGHKLIWSDDGSLELYDLNLDPEESVNRADEPAYAERRRAMERSLLELTQAETEQGHGGLKRLEVDAETEARLRELGYLD